MTKNEPQPEQPTREITKAQDADDLTRSLAKLQTRVMTVWITACLMQAFGAANRILEEGLGAVHYGASIVPAPQADEIKLFYALRDRADLVIRLFIEDHAAKLATSIQAGNINPRLKRDLRKYFSDSELEDLEEDSYDWRVERRG